MAIEIRGICAVAAGADYDCPIDARASETGFVGKRRSRGA